MGRRAKVHPNQLFLFSVEAIEAPPRKYDRPKEVVILDWLTEPAPLIHVSGKNLCRVTTFRSYDREYWVKIEWMKAELERHRYFKTHTLTTQIKDQDWVFDVYQPFGDGQN